MRHGIPDIADFQKITPGKAKKMCLDNMEKDTKQWCNHYRRVQRLYKMKTSVRNYEVKADGKWIGATVEVVYLEGNAMPYFSVTGEVRTLTKRGHKGHGESSILAMGCCHDILLKYMPDLKDIIDLHLSDSNGVPMHVIENGWYWCKNKDAKALAKHLRIDIKYAEELIRSCDNKNTFEGVIMPMYSRWNKEAQAVMEKYGLDLPKNYKKLLDNKNYL